MIRAGQAILFQLLAAGMMRSLTLSGEQALLQAQGGKNLMLLEIEGRLCIAPANVALQNLGYKIEGWIREGKTDTFYFIP